MILFSTRAADKLNAADPARAALVAKMVRYLNNLEGAAEEGTLARELELLRAQERFLSQRIDNLEA